MFAFTGTCTCVGISRSTHTSVPFGVDNGIMVNIVMFFNVLSTYTGIHYLQKRLVGKGKITQIK